MILEEHFMDKIPITERDIQHKAVKSGVFWCFLTHESTVKVKGELDIRSRVIPTTHLTHGKQTDVGKL